MGISQIIQKCQHISECKKSFRVVWGEMLMPATQVCTVFVKVRARFKILSQFKELHRTQLLYISTNFNAQLPFIFNVL